MGKLSDLRRRVERLEARRRAEHRTPRGPWIDASYDPATDTFTFTYHGRVFSSPEERRAAEYRDWMWNHLAGLYGENVAEQYVYPDLLDVRLVQLVYETGRDVGPPAPGALGPAERVRSTTG